MIDISDISRTYNEACGEAYNDLVEEAGERLIEDANRQVAGGVRGWQLRDSIENAITRLAEDLCRAEGAWALTKTGRPRKDMVAVQRDALFTMMARSETLDRMPPTVGKWAITEADGIFHLTHEE